MNTKAERSLEQTLPDGQLVNRAWLLAHGYNRPRVDYFLRANKLEAVNWGIYRRPGPPLKWEHIVYSLNEMGCAVHVGVALWSCRVWHTTCQRAVCAALICTALYVCPHGYHPILRNTVL